LLAAAGLVDTARRVAARRWRELAWRLGLVALPAAVLAWSPTAETLTPGRWALFYMKMFTAYELAGRLDDALDAIDDGRALDPRTARAFELSLASPVAAEQKARIAAEIDRKLAVDQVGMIQRARWLRLLADESRRAQSRQLLEQALEDTPDDPALHRELAAWWLGAWRDPEARRRAQRELERATRSPRTDPDAALLRALLTGDGAELRAVRSATDRRLAPRSRMARAALAARRREATP
jgi:tetratricopeptide (TPR) repeat protein